MTERTVCTDALGVEHRRADPEFRIVSLVPSLTELLCELGLSGSIVGRTGFCIHPRETVKEIEKVGGTKDINVQKIREMHPTHVVVNIDENTKEIADELGTFVEHIVVTHPNVPRDNIALFDTMGFIFSAEERAAALVEQFTNRLTTLNRAKQNAACDVLYLIWRDPWMTISPQTYISNMLDLIGWHCVTHNSLDRYPSIELSDYVGRVSKVLLSSEPYPFREKHLEEVRKLFGSSATVSLVDGEMLSWYGSRSIEGLGYLNQLSAAESQERVA